jgi:hypothetical protein
VAQPGFSGNLINFDQQKYQYVPWQDVPPALGSLVEEPERESPVLLTIGGARTGDASVGRLITAVPPRGRGAEQIHEAIPPRPERTCKSSGARTDSKDDLVGVSRT